MGDETIITLIGRIDRALARIEAAARSTPPATPAPPSDDGRAAAIEQAHHALRSKVENAIAQLDRLIAAGEQG